MSKKLTQRQKQFLSQFLDFFHESKGPIHYVALAKRLEIGNVTAYEMLRLLEKQGLAEAEYHLPPGNRGPGRGKVFFRPTQAAINLCERLSGGPIGDESWKLAKQRILNQLQKNVGGGYEKLLNDLLVRIPEQRSPLLFITEMNTAIILTLASIQKTAVGKGLIGRLRQIGFPGEIGLIALAGIGAILSVLEDVNLKISLFLMEQSEKYQEMFTQLNAEKQEQLADFAREVARLAIK